MSGENETGLGLSPDEQAFFDTRGETAPAQEAEQPAAETEAPAEAQSEAPEGEADGQAPTKEPRHVPLSELLTERKKRQDYEKQVQDQREWIARADERLKLLTQPQKQEPEPQPPGPEDPLGMIDHTAREIEEIKAWRAEQQRTAHEQAQVQQVVTTYQAKAQEFTQQQPDFMDAYTHVREAHARRLAIQGVPAHEIAATVARDELSMAVTALQQGVNPAERLYALAKEYGYAPKAADPQPDTGALIDAKADTVARAKSLSQAGGQATPRAVNAKALADMSDDDFDAFISKQGSKGFRRALNS